MSECQQTVRSCQNLGNVCLGILNGSEVGLEELNLIRGTNFIEQGDSAIEYKFMLTCDL